MANEIDTFLGDLNSTEQDPFSTDTQDLPEFETVQETDATPVTEEKELPFHKNPKFKKYIEKEISKAIGSKPVQTELPVRIPEDGTRSDDISEVLERIIGNDTPEKVSAVRDFRKALKGMKDEARDEALDYFQKREAQAKELERQADDALEEAFDGIEETYGVDLSSNAPQARKTRADFVSFVQRIAPKNANGEVTEYPDLSESFDIFRNLNRTQQAPSNSKAKDIASRGMSRSTETRATQPGKRITWDTVSNDLERI